MLGRWGLGRIVGGMKRGLGEGAGGGIKSAGKGAKASNVRPKQDGVGRHRPT